MGSRTKIEIYDSTLRDGAQAEGVSFAASGKLSLAKRLDDFGIDFIEGGYAGSNEKDMAFFRGIKSAKLSHAHVVAFGSTRRANVDVTKDVFTAKLLEANTEYVTIYGKSWRLQVRDVLRTTEAENRQMVADTVGFLIQNGRKVFFDAEHFFDGYKDDPSFALAVLKAAEAEGARMAVLCDTNGGTLPHEIEQITAEVVAALEIPVGIHTHNDSGLAVANSIAGVRAGARQVQGCLNGYGERSGNANLCTLMPTLQLKMGYECVPETSMPNLVGLSRFTDELVNLRPDKRLPYVGQSSFSHKGGPHVNAVQKNPQTYEHVPPEAVGNERRVLVSELSGGSNVLLKAIEVGVGRDASKDAAREVLDELKKLESQGYTFEGADASFKILVQKVLKKHKAFFDLEGFRVIIEKRGAEEPCISEATVKLRVGEEVSHTVAEAVGPVDALDTALRRALKDFYPEIDQVQLKDFRVRILDPEEATSATTQVLIESGVDEESWGTVGVSHNIIEASWEALVDSVEYRLFDEQGSGES